jgi:hypothetical protein
LINPSNLQGRRNKKLFWLPAIAPLLSVILSTLIVFLTKADKHGVKIVKHIKRGLNPSSVHQIQLNGPHVGQAAKVGLISAIIALTASPHIPFLHIVYFNFDLMVNYISDIHLRKPLLLADLLLPSEATTLMGIRKW